MGFEGLHQLGLILLALGGGLLLLVFVVGAIIGRRLGMKLALMLPLVYLVLLAVSFPFFAVVIHDATSDLFMLVVIGSSLPASILALKWFSGVDYSLKILFFPVFILLGCLQYLAIGWAFDLWARIRRGDGPPPEKLKRMKRWGVLAAALICLVIVATAVQPILEKRTRTVELKEDTEYRGHILPRGSQVRSKKGSYDVITLAGPLEINGTIWEQGTQLAGLDQEGHVRSIRLPRAKEIQGVRCRASGRDQIRSAIFNNSGKIQGAMLDGAQEIRGIRCGPGPPQQPGGGSTNYDIMFFPNGKISWAFLAEDQDVQGMILAGGSRLIFSQAGKVTNAVLAVDQEIRDVRFAADSTVVCDQTGAILKGSLAGPQEIGGLMFGPWSNTDQSGGAPGTHDIEFYRSGAVKLVFPIGGQVYRGVILSGDRQVLFHENGPIQSAWLEEDQEIQGMKVSANREVWFHPSGRISNVWLAEPWSCQGMEFPMGSKVHLSQTGSLQKVCLGEDAVIQGMACRKHQTLLFDAEGKVKPLPHPD